MESLLSYLPNFMLQPLFWVLAWLSVAIFNIKEKKIPEKFNTQYFVSGLARRGVL